MEDVTRMAELTKFSVSRMLSFYGVSRSTFYGWSQEAVVSPGKRRNMLVVLPSEEQAVIDYRRFHREIGYRKLTWEMNDAGVFLLERGYFFPIGAGLL